MLLGALLGGMGGGMGMGADGANMFGGEDDEEMEFDSKKNSQPSSTNSYTNKNRNTIKI